MFRLGWHFDFHSDRRVRIGHSPRFVEAAAALRRNGVDEVILFAKCHTGFAYYPTAVGTPHPRMRGDLFGGMLQACRRDGLKVVAYLSFGVDGEAGRKHPAWRQHFPSGPEWNERHFICVCPFTHYTDQLMLPQIDEISLRYRPDGFFFDTMSAFYLCHCPVCRREFRREYGAAIPRDPGDPRWGAYGRFRHDRGMALIDRIGRLIHERLPQASVGFNQLGSAPYPEKLPPSITRVTLDPATYGHQSHSISFCAAYGSNVDRPAEVMPTLFNEGWGDWSLATPERLEQVAAAAWARHVRLFMGDRLHPAGRLAAPSCRALKLLGAMRASMSRHFPPAASQPADEVAVLNSSHMAYGGDWRHFALDPRGRLGPVEAARQLVADAGAGVTVCGEDFLEPLIGRVKLVILPELPGLSPQADGLLAAFLRRGGRVLVVGAIPRVNGHPVDWLGVAVSSRPWQDHIWLPHWREMAHDMPVLVRGAFHRVMRRGARSVVRAIAPYDLAHGTPMGWGIGPPGDVSRYPAVTRNRFGKGEAWFLAAPIFTDYRAGLNAQQIEWMKGLIDRVLPRPAARLAGSPGNVEMVVRASPRTTWVTLINHGGEELAPGKQPWPRLLGPLPPYRAEIELRSRRRHRQVRCNGRPCKAQWRRGLLRIPVVMDQIWKVARVDWE